MPNHSKVPYNIFLKLLWEFSAIKTQQDFAKACAKQPANMGGYINGNLKAGKRVAKSSFDSYRKWHRNQYSSGLFNPIAEVSDILEADIPKEAGVYMLYNSSAQVIYIGKAGNFKTEVAQTLNRKVPISIRIGHNLKKTKPTIRELTKYISLYQIDDAILRANMEALLIRVSINHTHNSNLGHFTGVTI